MNKKLYKIGIKLNIEYTKTRINFNLKNEYLFQRITKVYDEYIIRNVKYVYASSSIEAVEKYQTLWNKTYTSLLGWGDWYSYSDHIDVYCTHDPRFKIKNQEIIVIKENCSPKNIGELKENISAYDFRDWWHDYHCNDIEEVLK